MNWLRLVVVEFIDAGVSNGTSESNARYIPFQTPLCFFTLGQVPVVPLLVSLRLGTALREPVGFGDVVAGVRVESVRLAFGSQNIDHNGGGRQYGLFLRDVWCDSAHPLVADPRRGPGCTRFQTVGMGGRPPQ